jgi:hypothetical protein
VPTPSLNALNVTRGEAIRVTAHPRQGPAPGPAMKPVPADEIERARAGREALLRMLEHVAF